MEKVQIRKSMENTLDGYLDIGYAAIERWVPFSTDKSFDDVIKEGTFAEEMGPLINILRQVFLFFPGTFILHFAGANLTLFWMVEKAISLRPFNAYYVAFLIVGIVMTISGIGNIKKLRHLAIPASIILVGMLSGIFTYFLTNPGDKHLIGTYLTVLLLPLALTVPFLAKYFVDKGETTS